MDDGDVAEIRPDEARRSLLKKAAVVGSAAWIAPTVLSQAAVAQGSVPACPGCQNLGAGQHIQICGQILVQFVGPDINGDPMYVIVGTPGGPNPGTPAVTCVRLTSGGSHSEPVAANLWAVRNPNSDPVVFCVSFTCV